MMEFNEFIGAVMDKVKDYLPEGYANAELMYTETKKINQSYPALTIRKEGEIASPSINLTDCYDAYKKGESLDSILAGIAEVSQRKPKGLEVAKLTNYEYAKDKLFIRICDAGTNKELLTDKPHKVECGLAITYHLMIDLGEDGIGSTMVNNDLMKDFGVSMDQLHKDAVENSPNILPATITPIESQLSVMLGISDDINRPMTFDESIENIDFARDKVTIVSNREGINGAAVIFYPEVLEKIGDKMEMDFFIIPSSTHEQLIFPDDGSISLRELTAMVKDVNNNEVKPADRLSYTVLHYDSKERLLEKGADFEDRTRDKKEMNKNESRPKVRKEKGWER